MKSESNKAKMSLREFMEYTNVPYDSLNQAQKELVDTIDYAEQNGLHIVQLHSRGVFHTNIIEIYKQYKKETNNG